MNKDSYIRIKKDGKIIYELKTTSEDNKILEECYNHFGKYIAEHHCVDGIVGNDELLDICKSDSHLAEICKSCDGVHDFCKVIPKKGEKRKGIYIIADMYIQNSYCPHCGEGIDKNEHAHSKDISKTWMK